jgi:L-ascorbate metabolism protein UlaG (beta-lactamase superfamily)
MQIQLIRHATLLLTINRKRILVDPMLSSKGAMPAIPHVMNTDNNPIVDLPVDISQLLDIDAIFVTHTHHDHFDVAAATLLPKEVPVFCQPEDTAKIESYGFQYVNPIETSYTWNEIRIHRTGGKHGTGEIGEKMAPVSGFVLLAENEPSLYIVGDSIWCEEVADTLELFHPDVAVCFAGSAQFHVGDPITMNTQDIYNVCKKSPATKVIAVHMEAWNHCTLARKDLKYFLTKERLTEQVYIPEDGETMKFNHR